MGTTSYDREFIRNYSTIASPLTDLTNGDTKGGKNKMVIQWTHQCDKVYKELKRALVSPPLLVHFFGRKDTVLRTDASYIGIGGEILQHQDDDGSLPPVAYVSRK